MKANATKHSLRVTVGSMVPGHGIMIQLSCNTKADSMYYLPSSVHTGLDISAPDVFLSCMY